MEIPSVPEYYKPLSLRVCKILDNIGASEEIRQLCVETSSILEIVMAFVESRWFGYIFGSKAEGTSTVGLNSDTDMLTCVDSVEVLQCLSDACIPIDIPLIEQTFIMVRDENTKPGYTKLQLVEDGVPLTRLNWYKKPEDFTRLHRYRKSGRFEFDSHFRLVLKHYEHYDWTDYDSNFRIHGPAGSFPARDGVAAQDFVPAYRCRAWPDDASEWLIRPRKYCWPPQGLIKQMKSLSFFLVHVGHPYSSDSNSEFRISLSLQERLLMFSLNPTQFKCYILLKMVKKDVVNMLLGEDSISSYHCKTCLFYMIENTPGRLWQPHNLLACLQGCLKCLLMWVTNNNCPNYFVSGENMFEGRIYGDLRTKLQFVLETLLTADCMFLSVIQSDYFGQHMKNAIFPGCFTPDPWLIARRVLYFHVIQTYEGLSFRNGILKKCRNKSREECIRKLFDLISNISHAETITEHTRTHTSQAARLFLPCLEMCLIANIVANLVLQRETEKVLHILLSFKLHELSARSDCFSVKLKQAAFLYILGHHEASLEILVYLASKYSGLQMSYCACRTHRNICLPKKCLLIARENTLSYEECIYLFVVFCVIFTVQEKDLVPTALAYEMIKSIHMPSESGDSFEIKLPSDWAVVDAKVLLYFMLFLNHSQLNMKSQIRHDMNYMRLVLNTDQNLHHRETALNLIGWCYKKEGNINKAIQYFAKSLALQKQHNAAYWHLLFTLGDLISRENKNRQIHACSNCLHNEDDASLKRCAICRFTRYCSKECQAAHWPFHKAACKIIQALKAAEQK